MQMKRNKKLSALGVCALLIAPLAVVSQACDSGDKDDSGGTGAEVEGDPTTSATTTEDPTDADDTADDADDADDSDDTSPDMTSTGTSDPTGKPTTTTDPTNTGAPTMEPTSTGPGPKPTDSGAPTSDPTLDPTTSAPTSDPSSMPTDPVGAGGMEPNPMGSTPTEPTEMMECETPEEDTFSFFMISYDAIRRFSGSDEGFGGNLGGISGADDLCKRAALESSTCAGNQTWHAFLSTTKEDAIDRIGAGPWRDRVGRLWANNVEELLEERPPNADPEIIDDIPNEYGIPNQFPNSDSEAVDNHETLTGTGLDGRLYTQEVEDAGAGGPGGGFGGGGGSTACRGGWTPEKATCWDWTSDDPEGCPRVGHSWPSEFSGVSWISVWNESGCAPGVTLVQGGLAEDDYSVGSYGGYGGFYCFAVTGE